MIALALLLALQAGPGAPVSADGPRPAARSVGGKTVKVSDPDKLICRANLATGHHIADHVCHTQRDWIRMEEDGMVFADRATRSQNACGGVMSC